MSTRAIATSTLWQIASQVVMAILSVLTAKFVAIGLAKEMVGYYNSSYGYLQIFSILADFGLYAVSVRELSKAQNKENVLGTLLVLRCIITVIALGSAVVSVYLIPIWRGTPFPITVAIAALVPFFTLLAGIMRVVFQVTYKMHFVFVAEVAQRVLTTAAIGAFIWYGVRLSTDLTVLESFLWIGAAGAALLFLISYLYASTLMRIRPHFEWSLFKKMLILAAPFGVSYLLITLYRQLDGVFITLVRPDFALQNAAYGFAGRVKDLSFLVPTLLLNSALPVLSERLEKNQDVRRLLGKTLLLILLMGMIFLLLTYFWARPLTLLFATDAYLSTPLQPGTDRAFELSSIPMLLNGVILFCFYVSLAEHRWRQMTLNFAAAVLLTVVLNVLWTPSLGFTGAAWALIVVHVLLAAVLLPQTLSRRPVILPLASLTRGVVFSLLLGLFLFLSAPYLTSTTEILAGLGLLALIMAGAAYVTGLHREFVKLP